MKKITTILLLVMILLSLVPGIVTAAIVDPPSIVAHLKAGETERDTITVNLPPTSPKGDVVFIFDASSSMASELTEMKTKASDIMTSVRANVPDTNFGVGSIVDYPFPYNSYGYDASYGGPGDYAWRMDQDLTSNTALISTAFNGITILHGDDFPQDYVRGLYESQFYAWRTDAKKIVVIIGDAPPHAEPSGSTLPAPYTLGVYGGDPGRDEVMLTADDLNFAPVVQSLADNKIVVIAVDCSDGKPLAADATRAFQYEADKTGGTRFDSTSTTIAEDIVAKINAVTSAPVSTLTLIVREPAYSGWISVTPPEYLNVPWGTTKTFDVAITPPADTISGTYVLHLDVFGDGVLLGTTTLTKTIGSIPGVPEFPTLLFPAVSIIGFLGAVLLILRTREH
jgi:hypothetical protein